MSICLHFHFQGERNSLMFMKTYTVRKAIEEFLRENNLKMDYSTEYIIFQNGRKIINTDKYLDEPLECVLDRISLNSKNSIISVFLTKQVVGG